ncbi:MULTISPECIES: type VI secretion system immunity protein, TaeI family [Acinetobacter]|uniref:type VI secretion system immunity protein, TaeI family n=1 Tax=Acinetobacter TaxID=469 RepID=UPI0007A0B617|nr:type VI secretion system immunity protein, TaeI family [Acinetobacter sp. NRRL B-65365]KYQ80472.1 glutamyl-tRNA amidotransferase [Acinetobacter sp. NRRL B-65365]
MLHPDYEKDFREMFGEPIDKVEVTDELIKKYRGKLPESILEQWRVIGFAGYLNGLYWITNPDDYEEVIYDWLEDTPLVDDDVYYVLARSAFGELLLWGENNFYRYYIKPMEGILHDTEEKTETAEFYGDLFFFYSDKDSLDHIDKNGKKLFDRAVKKLGVLKADEMYAFEPALALGGEESLSHLAKVNLPVHMKLLKQVTPLHLRDFGDLSTALYGVSYNVDELVSQDSIKQESVKAGDICPKSGYWFTVSQENSRRYFKQGDVLPEIKNQDWGEVYWQFDGE